MRVGRVVGDRHLVSVNRLEDVSHQVLAVAGAVLIAVAAIVAVVAVWRAWRAARSPQLVVLNLADGIGNKQSATDGISQTIRESLLMSLYYITKRASELLHGGGGDAYSPEVINVVTPAQKQLLLDGVDQSNSDLTKSITGLAPDSSRPALQLLLATVLRPKGSRVTGVVQLKSEMIGGLGVSFAVNDLTPGRQAIRFSIWESPDGPGDAPSVVWRMHALCQPAAVMLSCELIRQRLLAASERRARTLKKRLNIRKERDSGAVNHAAASVYLLMGTLYQLYARRMAPATFSYYEASVRDLRCAKDLWEHHLIFESLGNALAEHARRTGDQSRASAELDEALGCFEKALTLLDRSEISIAAKEAEQRRISMNRAIVLMLLSEQSHGLTEDAKAAVSDVDQFDEFAEHNPLLLYGWACVFGIAHRAKFPVPDAGAKARRLLMLCWIRSGRDRGWQEEACLDLDLQSVMTQYEAAQVAVQQLDRRLNGEARELTRSDLDTLLTETHWHVAPS